jgi:hypothetical protein
MLKRRGQWRTLLGRKGELWYYTDEATKEGAPKPHRLTLLIGLLSPMLALAAIWISYRSFQTSERSMKVGQRAYLSSTLYVEPNVSESKIVSISFRAKITNLGNTPASIENISYSIVDKTQDFTQDSGGSVSRSIDAKGSLEVGKTVFLPVDLRCIQGALCFQRQFVGSIEWRDIFEDFHHDSWCLNSALYWNFLKGIAQISTEPCSLPQRD